MAESTRAFGYDPGTAVADLVDNSISANARNVWFDFGWDGYASWLSLTDDGDGMSPAELEEAMGLGSLSPLEPRKAGDLGRFGLGLKTASFSQCRRLIVATKKSSSSEACWDLDYIARKNDWLLLTGEGLAESDRTKRLDKLKHGTVVIWEKMDRLAGNTKADDKKANQLFLERMETIQKHLGMVFHRYLTGPKRLKMWVKGAPLSAWDPFLTDATATQHMPEELLDSGDGQVRVQPFVLPHRSKIDETTHKLAAGPDGWNASQGFYVYRNRRLLVPGDWLGLGFTKEPHYSLARIMVDITNDMDEAWQIDVKKSLARPPGRICSDLKRIARIVRGRAGEVYRQRGKAIAREAGKAGTYAWQKVVRHGKILYKIDRDYPLVRELLGSGGLLKPKLNALLRLLEETIPVGYIIAQNAEQLDKHAAPFEGVPTKDVAEVMLLVFRSLLAQGCTTEEARKRLSRTDPFDRYPELLATIDELAVTHPRKGLAV